MPNLDKTGPAGQGPQTGQGLGSCDENNNFVSRGFFGRGQRTRRECRCFCCGRRQGFFRRRNSFVSLEDQERFLEERLKAIREAKNKTE